jgi:predicted MFS family arabinose efflux permease
MAGVSGFLLGPALGVALARAAGATGGGMMVPLAATGGLALVAALAVALTVRRAPVARPDEVRQPAQVAAPQVVRWLLALGFFVSAGVAVFEVGLALRGRQDLGLDPAQIAMMFTLCSGVMIVVQAVVFSPLVRPEVTRWLIAPAFAIMAAALFSVPLTADFRLMLVVVGAVAASAGILSPILTYWVASHGGHKSGAELGKQTAAASLGAALGSAAGGLLYDVTWLPNAAFVLTAGVIALAVWPGLWLPGRLVPRDASGPL